MGGAASLAADKVVATVGSVKALPPHLEAEVKPLMLKARASFPSLHGAHDLQPLCCLESTDHFEADIQPTRPDCSVISSLSSVICNCHMHTL